MGPTSLPKLIGQLKNWFNLCKNGEQLKADPKGVRVIEFLSAVSGGSKKINTIVEACKKHRDLIVKWNLLKVTPNKIVSPFWLSKTEWTPKEINSFLPDEKFQVHLINECDSSLHINYIQAKCFVEYVGLRLPTEIEFKSAYDRLDKQQITRNPKPAQLKQTAALDKVGDFSTDGIVGLELGVREYVLSGELMGKPNNPAPEGSLLKIWDLGVRPALDLYPMELNNLK